MRTAEGHVTLGVGFQSLAHKILFIKITANYNAKLSPKNVKYLLIKAIENTMYELGHTSGGQFGCITQRICSQHY